MKLRELVMLAKLEMRDDWEELTIGISATSDGLHWVNTDNVEIEIKPEVKELWISEVGY